MKNTIGFMIRRVGVLLPVLLICMQMHGQSNSDYDKTIREIKDEFGIVPTMFKVYPKHALPGAWNAFKQLNSPESKIPPKYRELLQLAVAAQIPCQYCIYFHSASAKAFGATDEEIQEAIAQGAQTRYWSMVLQGNQVDLDQFKSEFNEIMNHMAAKASNR